MLGTSTRPVFTCFETMERVRTEVYEQAAAVYDGYIEAGLRERIPFSERACSIYGLHGGAGALSAFCFLSRSGEYDTMKAMRHMQELVRPALTDIYGITAEEADIYFRDMWLAAHSLSTLIVTGDCPYSDREIGEIFTGLSVSIYKAIKEIPGFAEGTFDRRRYFGGLTVGQGREAEYENNSPEKGNTRGKKVYSKPYNGRVL